eukprot:m.13885 g.13885  ORF g.13885 m.13885 type:complete len:480 (+) comp4945_c0_seq1:127-1566(+)
MNDTCNCSSAMLSLAFSFIIFSLHFRTSTSTQNLCKDLSVKIFQPDLSPYAPNLPDRILYNCTDITLKFTIPSNLKTIGKEAFRYSYGFTEELQLPVGLTMIDDYAFADTHLSSIVIPNTVTTMGEGVFFNNGKLLHLTLPNSLLTIPKNFCQSCRDLATVNFGSKVTLIAEASFAGTPLLRSVQLPETLVTISEFAFGNSGLTSIELPHSIKTIGEVAFSSCFQLKTFYGSNCRQGIKIADSAFDGCGCGFGLVTCDDFRAGSDIVNCAYAKQTTSKKTTTITGKSITTTTKTTQSFTTGTKTKTITSTTMTSTTITLTTTATTVSKTMNTKTITSVTTTNTNVSSTSPIKPLGKSTTAKPKTTSPQDSSAPTTASSTTHTIHTSETRTYTTISTTFTVSAPASRTADQNNPWTIPLYTSIGLLAIIVASIPIIRRCRYRKKAIYDIVELDEYSDDSNDDDDDMATYNFDYAFEDDNM